MSQTSAAAAGDYFSPETLQAATRRISAECHANAEALRFIAPVIQAVIESLARTKGGWFASTPAKLVGTHLQRSAAGQEVCAKQAERAWEEFQKKIYDPAVAAANQFASGTAPAPTGFRGIPRIATSRRRAS